MRRLHGGALAIVVATTLPLGPLRTGKPERPAEPATGSPSSSVAVTVQIQGGAQPHYGFELLQSYPNPFKGSTVIRYSLLRKVDVRLEVFSVAGRRVAKLAEGVQGPGWFSVSWDGRDERGRLVPFGVYAYRLQAGPYTRSRKLIVLQ